MTRSESDILAEALPRILDACRTRAVQHGGARVSENQLRILRLLDDQDPTMVGELAEALGVTPSTMSLNLKRLQEGGWVVRSRDPNDRRVMNVVLTEEGRTVRDRSAVLDRQRVDAVLRALRPLDRERAVSGLTLLAEAADRMIALGDAYVEALTEG